MTFSDHILKYNRLLQTFLLPIPALEFHCSVPAYLAAAHRHALADVGVQAGAAPANFLREPPVAPGQQKSIHRRLGHLTGCKARGIGADILRAVVFFLQRERQPRPLVLCHLDIAVAFIVRQVLLILTVWISM